MFGIDTRLELIAPDLARKILSSSEQSQRRVALRASIYAVDFTSLDNPIIREGLNALQLGIHGDTDLLKRLEKFINELDLIQWDLQESFEAGLTEEQDYIDAFHRARAASTLYFALLSDSREAATESVYEAIAATDELVDIEDVIDMELDNPTD